MLIIVNFPPENCSFLNIDRKHLSPIAFNLISVITINWGVGVAKYVLLPYFQPFIEINLFLFHSMREI